MVFLQGEAAGEHVLILCNAIGSPVDSKVVELEPKYVLLTGNNHYIVLCGETYTFGSS